MTSTNCETCGGEKAENDQNFVENRGKICQECDKLICGKICGVCKCIVAVKIRFKKQSCPLGKWPKIQ